MIYAFRMIQIFGSDAFRFGGIGFLAVILRSSLMGVVAYVLLQIIAGFDLYKADNMLYVAVAVAWFFAVWQLSQAVFVTSWATMTHWRGLRR